MKKWMNTAVVKWGVTAVVFNGVYFLLNWMGKSIVADMGVTPASANIAFAMVGYAFAAGGAAYLVHGFFPK